MQKEQQEKVIKALAAYNGNKAKLKMLDRELANLDKMMNANMAIKYDEYRPKEKRQQSVVERDLLSIEEKRGLIQNEIVRLTGEIERIDILLENVPERLRIILKTKYIEQQTWVAVDMQLNYNESYIRKELKKQALETAYELLFSMEAERIEQ